ncbi:MAG: FAD-dependent oxidoreductase [Thermoleophilia bacterium]|jgi:heterodisulfide reductase subunit A-like polyferredoxin|nr:FAD-dependent oxidoreductase [Thermoleophilia bacterium]
MPGPPPKTTGAALVCGGGVAGIQCALDLAEGGYKVHLVEKAPALGGHMAQLDKTFPTNDCSMCTLAPKLVEAGRHLNIDIVTNSELIGLEGEPGDFKATVYHHARFVDPDKCTSCGECVPVCPVKVEDQYNEDLGERTAIYKLYPQAIPNTYAVTKKGHAPCKRACAVSTSAQGYVALIRNGKFAEAYTVASEPNPFPAVCGRVCTARCEVDCTRGEVDDPIAIRSLKRFVTDFANENVALPEKAAVTYDEKVAVIGAGPSGLTAARELALLGYETTVYESKAEPGGMLRHGIPEYRLPKAALQQDVDRILALGVDLQCGKKCGVDVTVDGLLDDGYKAVYMAVGLQGGRTLPIPGADAPNVLDAVSLLYKATVGEPVEMGKKVVVIGGGDVAFDAGRTALRLGAEQVVINCIEDDATVPASDEEVEEGLAESILFNCSCMPDAIKVDEKGRACGVTFSSCALGEPDARGWRPPVRLDGTDHDLDCDTVIFAIGQSMVDDFLQGATGIAVERGQIVADKQTHMTARPGVFAGGDASASAPWTAIEAVAAGRRAARSIHNHLRGEELVPVWDDQMDEAKPDDEVLAKTEVMARLPMPQLAGAARKVVWDEVNTGFTEEQAVAEASRCLDCAICSECFEYVRACGPGALLHGERDAEYTYDVGAVVLATGFDLHDPGSKSEYGYRRYPNVLSALEYERMLSASGPTIGDVKRPSDGAHPKKVAFIQCVGSRDQDHEYCSSVCCMFANKQAMLTIDHVADCEPTVFLMDMRAQGKGFDAFYQRAVDRGVKFVRSRPSNIKEDPATGDLLITGEDESGVMRTSRFDMVVLSAGLEPSRKAQEAAGHLGIALNRHGFCELHEFEPLATSRKGVFVAGPFGEPKDIPDSVAQASAAAAQVMTGLADSRGTLTVDKEYPAERAVSEEEPRIGVFVCHCGSNIAGVIGVESVAEYAQQLPGVEFATDTMYTCSSDSLSLIKEKIEEHQLNRVVVASCTPRTHEPIFQDTLREAGLNPFLFEMANIRDQASWVHAQEPEKATDKAKDLVRMSVARARMLEPLYKVDVPLTHSALVIGGGVAGMTAAAALGEMGHEVHLVERSPRLGGHVLELGRTIRGGDPSALVAGLEQRLIDNPNVKIHLESELIDFHGFIGNFSSVVKAKDGARTPIDHGVVVVATGSREDRPELFGLGQSPKVVTGMELERMLKEDDPALDAAGAVGFVLCAGSLDEHKPYCSRTCCQQSIKNAIALKEKQPDRPVYVWFKEVRTFGLLEEYYTRARELGVVFTRYDDDTKPVVSANGRVEVAYRDPFLRRDMTLPVDLLVLATPAVPTEGGEELSKLLKVPLTSDGFYLEAHVKLRPVDFASEGLFLAGSAHYPKSIDETISQAYAAAGRAAAILAKPALKAGGVVAEVDQEKCAACLTCVRVCPYEVPIIEADSKKAKIEAAACQGCGICVSECPVKAITLHHYTDAQVFAKEEALFMEVS